MGSSLPELVVAAQAGGRDAFNELVRRFQDMAVGFAFARLRDRALAEDSAQEAFLDAYRVLDQLREPAAFPAWFRRILLKQIDRIQRVKARPPSLEQAAALAACGEATTATGADPLDQLTARAQSARVLAEVLALPEALRTSVVLFYVGGHTVEEIANFTEEPSGTIKRRLHDARGKLQERMLNMIEESLEGLRPSASDAFVQRVSALLQAVAQGDKSEVLRLVADEPAVVGATGKHPIWGGEPHPLQVAAELGKTELVALLLERGADPDARSPGYDWSPLQLAVHKGHRETASALMAHGATVDLCSAAGLGDALRAQEITRRDPSAAKARGPNGTTPLHFAASVEVARILLEAGADPLALDGSGNPPHQMLVGFAQRREVARYVLCVSGAEPELSFLVADGDLDAVANRLAVSPSSLEQYGREFDGAARLSRGALPLHVAVLHGQLAVARLLLERGALVDSRTRDGQTALHLAAGAGQVALVELLLERGADAATVDAQHGSTPLGWAEFHHARLGGPDSCLVVAALLRTRVAPPPT
ncbi:MAG TPA: sigma-70 family RNA polymerase sigma factor [Polyangiaceae bacterium]|jgi:RNA polymerase sigma factor (sigma-70 family)